jgi:hypothetical protein
MAHFYMNAQGNRGEVTRMGTKNSGMFAHVRGWSSGIRVEAYHDEEAGEDCFRVYSTGGSNDHNEYLLGVLIDGRWVSEEERERLCKVTPQVPALDGMTPMGFTQASKRFAARAKAFDKD